MALIRPAEDGDAAAVADLWNPFIRDTAITFTTDEKTPADILAMMAARRAAGHGFFVAVSPDGAGIGGFASYGPFRAGPGYRRTVEHTVILRHQAQGRGLGRALMAELIAHARASGIHVMIGGVSGENPQGAAFHSALGFDLIARLPQVGYKFGRAMDLLLFQKILS